MHATDQLLEPRVPCTPREVAFCTDRLSVLQRLKGHPGREDSIVIDDIRVLCRRLSNLPGVSENEAVVTQSFWFSVPPRSAHLGPSCELVMSLHQGLPTSDLSDRGSHQCPHWEDAPHLDCFGMDDEIEPAGVLRFLQCLKKVM